MQTENDTSKPETELKQETGEGCPGATCSPLDLYATAALNGLLSNPTVIASMGARGYIDGNADGVPAKLVEAAFHYAKYALKLRSEIILENTEGLASTAESEL
jgi:hypothetical protein